MGAGMVSTVRVLYVHHRGGSLAIISSMAIAFLVSNFVFQYPWGWAADRFGRRRVILIGLFLQAGVSVSYVFVQDPVLFVVLRLVEGAAAASILPAARAAIADLVPDESRGRAYGIFSMFFNIGFLFGPGLGGLLAVVGYSRVFVVAAILRLVGAAVVFLGVGTAMDRRMPVGAQDVGARWLDLFSLGLLGAYIIAFGDYLWLGFDLTLAPLWMRHHLGASLPLIGLAYSTWSLPSAIMAPIGGRLADRHRRWLLILIGGLGQLPMYAVYVSAHSIYPVIAGFVIQATLYSVVTPAVDAHVARASPVLHRGRVQSIYSAVGVAGAFAGATIFVPLYALDYRLPLVVEGIGYGAVVVAGSLMIRAWQSRQEPVPEAVPTPAPASTEA